MCKEEMNAYEFDCEDCKGCEIPRDVGGMGPRIEIDADAIRFIYSDSQINLFWEDLFCPRFQHISFQSEVMMNLKRIYDECVRLSK